MNENFIGHLPHDGPYEEIDVSDKSLPGPDLSGFRFECDVPGCTHQGMHKHLDWCFGDGTNGPIGRVDDPPPMSAENSFYVEWSTNISWDDGEFKATWTKPGPRYWWHRVKAEVRYPFYEAWRRLKRAWAALCDKDGDYE